MTAALVVAVVLAAPQSRGVVFVPYICPGTPVVQADGAALSAPQDARVPQCSGPGDILQSLARADLSTAHGRVSVRIHNSVGPGSTQPVTLTGTDAGGTVATASAIAPDSGWTTLTVAQPAGQAPRITRVYLDRVHDDGNRLDIDNLAFDNPSTGGGLPPAPAKPTASFSGGPSSKLGRASLLDGSRSFSGIGRG